MTASLAPPDAPDVGPTLQELLDRVGDVPARRIRLHPYPATEEDVLHLDDHEDRLCELVEGVLVEKAMGAAESSIAVIIGSLMLTFAKPRKLGTVLGEAGMMRLRPKLVRIPDASFIEWRQFPNGKMTRTPIPAVFPDIAVEVLSESNTAKEMERKRGEYFEAGTRLVWIVDPDSRTVAVYTPDEPHVPKVLNEPDTVFGAPVLPGFSFAVRELFEELDS